VSRERCSGNLGLPSLCVRKTSLQLVDQSKTAIALAELGKQIRGKNFRQIFLFLVTQMLLKARFGGILSSLEASGNDYKNSSSSTNTHLPKTTRSSLRHSRAASILIMKLSASLATVR